MLVAPEQGRAEQLVQQAFGPLFIAHLNEVDQLSFLDLLLSEWVKNGLKASFGPLFAQVL
jgi:hypothetical protein